MKIANIKHFAEAYNDLKTYFNKIEPYEIRQVSLFPNITGPYTSNFRKFFNADDRDIPYNSGTLRKLYNGFIEELSDVVLDYSEKTVRAMLESYFSKSADVLTNNYGDVFANNLSEIFKNDREDLIEIIELFNEVTNRINSLINGPKTEECYGIVLLGPYDSFKEKAMKKRLQKDNETKKALTDESAHKLSEDEKDISESLLNIFKNDKATLNKFLSRIKGKFGVKVVIEVQALMKLNKICKEDVNRPLWAEISKIQNIGSESNWNTVLANKHSERVKAIIGEY